MWAIIKFKKKNFHSMKRELIERNSGKTNFYQPLIKVQKKRVQSLVLKNSLSLEIIFFALIKILQTKILFTH